MKLRPNNFQTALPPRVPLFRPYDPKEVRYQQKYAAAFYERCFHQKPTKANDRIVLPGALDQYAAAQEVVWLVERAARWDAKLQAKGYVALAVTVVHIEGRLRMDQLTPEKIVQAKRRIQRHVRERLPLKACGLGAVEIDIIRDPTGPELWMLQLHEHFILWVRPTATCATGKAIKSAVRKAFGPAPGAEAVSVKPVVVKSIKDRDGWIDYCAKGFFLRGIAVRSSYLDRNGTRNARDLNPPFAQLACVIPTLEVLKPTDRTLLIGFRKVHGKLRRSK